MDPGSGESPPILRRLGLIAGPAMAIAIYVLLPAEIRDGAGKLVAGDAARRVAAVGVLMAIWWLTEALPLEATALIPLAAFPLLRVGVIKNAAAPYASDVIFLFMGGLMLGLSMERWGLHRRVAMAVLSMVGTTPAMLVGGIMLATALISMWVSNTATAVMMLPIGMSIAGMVGTGGAAAPDDRPADPFATALMLGIAYASSIGGVGTIVGTPPNAVLVNQARDLKVADVSFAEWLWIGVPTVAVFLPIAWLVLTRVVFRVSWRPVPGVREAIARDRAALGPMSTGEAATLVAFLLAAVFWVFREPIGIATGLIYTDTNDKKVEWLTDAGIAMSAALLLFLCPARDRTGAPTRVLDWPTAVQLPWGVLLLFGGGLSLAEAMTSSGLDKAIGGALSGLGGVHPFLAVLVVTAVVVFLTEVASNTAIATTFIPIAYAAAPALGLPPLVLMLPVALAASYAFMMPMGTPPNALVFASGHVTIRQMCRAGIVLNLAAIVVITVLCYLIGPWLLGTGAGRG